MQLATIIEILKVELFKSGFYYDVKYKLNGQVKCVEICHESNDLKVGDVIEI